MMHEAFTLGTHPNITLYFETPCTRQSTGYFHPQVSRIVDTVRYAKVQKARGVLLVPRWVGAAFWAVIQAEDKFIEVKKFKPFLEAPQWFRNSTFKGSPKFEFAVFEMIG